MGDESAARRAGCGAWHVADVLVVALLGCVLVMPTLGTRLMSTELGHALHHFTRLERVVWSATWGAGAWALLASALCDLVGRSLE